MEELRYLTDNEIADIVNDTITSSMSIKLKDIEENIISQLRYHLYEHLKTLKLYPRIIPELKREISLQYRESLIRSGKMVGPLATEAISASLTQSALNSFHSSGAMKNFYSGIQALKNLLAAKINEKEIRCNIRFIDSPSDIDILREKRQQLVEINLSDLVEDYEYLNNYLQPDTNPEDFFWYSTYFQFFPDQKENIEAASRVGKYLLRLTIDGNILYTQRITPEKIINVLLTGMEKENKKMLTSKDLSKDLSSGKYAIIYSPLLTRSKQDRILAERDILLVNVEEAYFYLDFYVNRDKVHVSEERKENIELTEMERVIISSLEEIQIKGINGIKNIYPIPIPIWSMVKREEKYPDERNLWIIYIHRLNKKLNGLKIKDLELLLQSCGMIVKPYRENDDYIWIEISSLLVEEMLSHGENEIISPEKIVKYRLNQENKLLQNYRIDFIQRLNHLNMTDIHPRYQLPDNLRVLRNAQKYAAISEGTNLTLLSFLSRIDFNNTFSSNIMETYYYFGIEAARMSLVRLLYQSICNGDDYINPRHIQLIADFLTFSGNVSKIGYSGISKQSNEVIQQMSTQRPLEALMRASSFSLEDPLRGVSGAVAVGIPANIGDEYRRSQGLPIETLPSGEPIASRVDVNSLAQAIDSLFKEEDLV